jgi:hypothetical protein
MTAHAPRDRTRIHTTGLRFLFGSHGDEPRSRWGTDYDETLDTYIEAFKARGLTIEAVLLHGGAL